MNIKLKPYKEFVEKELIPLEPLLINHQYDELYSELDKKRDLVKKLNLGHLIYLKNLVVKI